MKLPIFCNKIHDYPINTIEIVLTKNFKKKSSPNFINFHINVSIFNYSLRKISLTNKSVCISFDLRAVAADQKAAFLACQVVSSPDLFVADFALLNDIGGSPVLEGVVVWAGSSGQLPLFVFGAHATHITNII